MDDYSAYIYDCSRRLLDAVEGVSKASRSIHNDEPPWRDAEDGISAALAALHIARVHLAAARYSYAKAVHVATVGKSTDDDTPGESAGG